jgi:UDP-N-acetylglucosamine diphosphorylase/glucosamine-1-phosphate N-acetyltransferase
MTQADGNAGGGQPEAIILAAGKGTRMGGDRPKVLYEAGGRPLVHWVVDACRDAGCRRCVLVVGYGADEVRDALAGFEAVTFVEQREQLGTGHATRQAEGLYDPDQPVDVFVLAGDMPLIRPAILREMAALRGRAGAAAVLGTARIDDPPAYGRVIRDAAGRFERIVEHKDATEAQRRITEVYPSYSCFRSDLLFQALHEVDNRNAQGEFYVTDVPGVLRSTGHAVELLDTLEADDVLGVNTPDDLEKVDRLLRQRAEAGTQG